MAASQIGLHINKAKTEFMSFNIPTLKTNQGKTLKYVNDFQYLGSWINSCEKDISTRIGKAWSALNKMDIIWKPTLQLAF